MIAGIIPLKNYFKFLTKTIIQSYYFVALVERCTDETVRRNNILLYV